MKITRQTFFLGATVAALALGWSCREAQWASAQGQRIPNTLLNATDVKMKPATWQGNPTGEAAEYFQGSTAGLPRMQVGRFLLKPGVEPHPPHRHADEEVLIVTQGTGEVQVDGTWRAVKPGAVMYADPNVEHGIKNTGGKPLEFYWIKYGPTPAK